mmetsp:Transcript_17079/g.60753  ORF Transcript_17079/g.60753 Transcript_17079/m.60753 type:complete len:206 (-) Transcript_17079:562-1179(-)
MYSPIVTGRCFVILSRIFSRFSAPTPSARANARSSPSVIAAPSRRRSLFFASRSLPSTRLAARLFAFCASIVFSCASSAVPMTTKRVPTPATMFESDSTAFGYAAASAYITVNVCSEPRTIVARAAPPGLSAAVRPTHSPSASVGAASSIKNEAPRCLPGARSRRGGTATRAARRSSPGRRCSPGAPGSSTGFRCPGCCGRCRSG